MPKTVNKYLTSIGKFVSMLKVEYDEMADMQISEKEVRRIEGLLAQMNTNNRKSIRKRASELKDQIQG